MNYTSKQVLQLLPQRAPIVMVDGAQQEGETYYALLTIAPDNWFVEDNQLLEAGVVEHQAQSVAVCLGLKSKEQGQKTNRESQIGFIAEVKNLSIHRLPMVGETLATSITYNTAVENIVLIQATTTCQEERIAESQLKIFLPS